MLGNLLKTTRQYCHLSEGARMSFLCLHEAEFISAAPVQFNGVEGGIERGCWIVSKKGLVTFLIVGLRNRLIKEFLS